MQNICQNSDKPALKSSKNLLIKESACFSQKPDLRFLAKTCLGKTCRNPDMYNLPMDNVHVCIHDSFDTNIELGFSTHPQICLFLFLSPIKKKI